MSTKKKKKEQAAKKELKAMHLLIEKLAEWGAADSEPFYGLNKVLEAAIRGSEFPVKHADYWELYSSRPGWKSAANKMTKQAKKVYESIQQMPLRDARAFADCYGITF